MGSVCGGMAGDDVLYSMRKWSLTRFLLEDVILCASDWRELARLCHGAGNLEGFTYCVDQALKG